MKIFVLLFLCFHTTLILSCQTYQKNIPLDEIEREQVKTLRYLALTAIKNNLKKLAASAFDLVKSTPSKENLEALKEIIEQYEFFNEHPEVCTRLHYQMPFFQIKQHDKNIIEFAIEKDNDQALALFIQHGANLLVCDAQHETYFHTIAEHLSIKCAQCMVNYTQHAKIEPSKIEDVTRQLQTAVNLRSKTTGLAPLHILSKKADASALIPIFLELKAHGTLQSDQNETPLSLALNHGHGQIAQTILEQFYRYPQQHDLTSFRTGSYTYAHLLAINAFEIYKQKKLNFLCYRMRHLLQIATIWGDTPLHTFIKEISYFDNHSEQYESHALNISHLGEILQIFVKHYQHAIHTYNQERLTPFALSLVRNFQSLDVQKIIYSKFLEYEIDVNSCNHTQQNCLHLAIIHNKINCAFGLVRQGFDPYAVDSLGKNAFDYLQGAPLPNGQQEYFENPEKFYDKNKVRKKLLAAQAEYHTKRIKKIKRIRSEYNAHHDQELKPAYKLARKNT